MESLIDLQQGRCELSSTTLPRWCHKSVPPPYICSAAFQTRRRRTRVPNYHHEYFPLNNCITFGGVKPRSEVTLHQSNMYTIIYRQTQGYTIPTPLRITPPSRIPSPDDCAHLSPPHQLIFHYHGERRTYKDHLYPHLRRVSLFD